MGALLMSTAQMYNHYSINKADEVCLYNSSAVEGICSHNSKWWINFNTNTILMNHFMRLPLALIAIVGLGVVFSSSGCRKKKDTIAKIYVYDVLGAPVGGATVRLYGKSTIEDVVSPPVVLDVTTTANSNGEATFNFNDVYQLGQAGVAVLDIDASFGSMVGHGIIKVEQETTSEEAVFI